MPQFSPGDQVELIPTATKCFAFLVHRFQGAPATVLSTDNPGSMMIRYADGKVDHWHESHFQLAGPPNNVRAMSNRVLREYQNARV